MRITASGYARSRAETKPRILWWDSLLMAGLLWIAEDQIADAGHVLEGARVVADVEAARAGELHVEHRPHRARPRAHDHHPVGEEDRLVDGVGDEEHRLGLLVPDPLQLEVHLLARHRVQRAERLVHQQEARLEQQGPADRDPLLHAAGQLARVVVRESLEADQADPIPGHPLTLLAGARRLCR